MVYIPTKIQQFENIDKLSQFVEEELRKISQALASKTVRVFETHVEPTRPRTGTVAFADGVNWDPGSGRGLYYFDTNAWYAVQFGSGSNGTGFVDFDYDEGYSTSDLDEGTSSTSYGGGAVDLEEGAS